MTRYRQKTLRALVLFLLEEKRASTAAIGKAFGFQARTTNNYLRNYPEYFESITYGGGQTKFWKLTSHGQAFARKIIGSSS